MRDCGRIRRVAICQMLEAAGYRIVHREILPDDFDAIASALKACADERKVCLVVTTGGTGFAPRDVTPEATASVLERLTPGIPEAMRAESMRITPGACSPGRRRASAARH